MNVQERIARFAEIGLSLGEAGKRAAYDHFVRHGVIPSDSVIVAAVAGPAPVVPGGMKTVTYGVMPTREEFDAAYEVASTDDGHGFRFRNDKRIGNGELTCSELWDELVKAHAEFEAGDEEAGDWCSAVLGCLDWEWV